MDKALAYLDQEWLDLTRFAGSSPARVAFSVVKLTLDPVAEWIRHWILLPFWQTLVAPRPLGDGATVEPIYAGSNPARVAFHCNVHALDPVAKWIRHWFLHARLSWAVTRSNDCRFESCQGRFRVGDSSFAVTCMCCHACKQRLLLRGPVA